MTPEEPAEFGAPNLVYLNSKDPLLDSFNSAPAALRLHVLRAIIAAIERVQDENFTAAACDLAVNTAVVQFYVKAGKDSQ